MTAGATVVEKTARDGAVSGSGKAAERAGAVVLAELVRKEVLGRGLPFLPGRCEAAELSLRGPLMSQL